MAKAQITCTTCNAVMGELEKDDITSEDISMYQRMMQCPNGHVMASTLEVVPDAPPADGG